MATETSIEAQVVALVLRKNQLRRELDATDAEIAQLHLQQLRESYQRTA